MTLETKLILNQNNDEEVMLILTNPDTNPSGLPYDLTGKEIDFWLKPSRNTPDTDPAVTKLSTVGGNIVVTNPTAGVATVTIPRADLTTAGTRWWRVDIVSSGGTRKTAGYGINDVVAV